MQLELTETAIKDVLVEWVISCPQGMYLISIPTLTHQEEM